MLAPVLLENGKADLPVWIMGGLQIEHHTGRESMNKGAVERKLGQRRGEGRNPVPQMFSRRSQCVKRRSTGQGRSWEIRSSSSVLGKCGGGSISSLEEAPLHRTLLDAVKWWNPRRVAGCPPDGRLRIAWGLQRDLSRLRASPASGPIPVIFLSPLIDEVAEVDRLTPAVLGHAPRNSFVLNGCGLGRGDATNVSIKK